MKTRVLISLFFIAVFVSFLGPIVDPDFPFHLKAGEYIYNNKKIPQDDPFSFYGEGIITDRERFTLSQYWISQIIFYKLYSLAGPTGIIIFRAMIFTTFFIIMWLFIKKRGLYSSLIIISLLVIMFQAIKIDRPQNFSFLFTLLIIVLIEKFRENPQSYVPLYFVPPIMLLWANMHAGFVFGIAIIVIYALSEALKFFVNNPSIGQPLNKKETLIFVIVVLLAVLFSYINPISNNQLITTFESHTDVNWLYRDNREYISPIKDLSVYYGNRLSSIIFFIILSFVTIIFVFKIVRAKSIDLTAFSVFIFSSVAAFTAVRYVPFFVAIALPLFRDYRFFQNENYLLLNRIKKSSVVFFLFLIFFMLHIIFAIKNYQYIFKFGPSDRYPESVANFLLNNPMHANIFNQFNKGSYLMWRLYPHYKLFNDTRFISLEAVYDTDAIAFALDDYNQPTNLALANALGNLVPEELGRISIQSTQIQNKHNGKLLWKRLLNKYDVNIIVHEATGDFRKELYPLVLRLIKDDDWVLIYLDGAILMFVRNSEKYSEIIKKFKLPKELIYDQIILETMPLVSKKVAISTPYSSLAFALMMKGDHEKARIMIDAALELDEKDIVAHFCNAYLVLKQKARKQSLAINDKNDT